MPVSLIPRSLNSGNAAKADMSSAWRRTTAYFSSSFRDYFGMTPKEFVAQYIHTTDPDILDKLFKG